jgi:hypothetical protein
LIFFGEKDTQNTNFQYTRMLFKHINSLKNFNSALLGSLIFLIAAMDNPFRGEFSVSADSFQLLLDGLMK